MPKDFHSAAIRLLQALQDRDRITKCIEEYQRELTDHDRTIGRLAGEMLPAMEGRGRLLKVRLGYDTYVLELWDEQGQPGAILLDVPDAWEIDAAEADTEPPVDGAHAAVEAVDAEVA